MSFKRSIKFKILAAFSGLILCIACLGVFALYQLAKVNRTSSDVATHRLPTVQTLGGMQLLLARIRASQAQHMSLELKEQMAANEASASGLVKKLSGLLLQYKQQASTDRERALSGDIDRQVREFLRGHDSVIVVSRSGNKKAAVELGMAGSADYRSLLESINSAVALSDLQVRKSEEIASAAFDQAEHSVIVFIAVVLMGSLAIALRLANMITKPLVDAVGVSNQIASGDLVVDIREAKADETGNMLRALEAMSHGLIDVVSKVSASSQLINTAVTEIAIGNLDLSSRTEQQAAALEETASSMETLVEAVKKNAASVRDMGMQAKVTSQLAEKAEDVMQEASKKMSLISDSASQISRITAIIDGIAFQTNILALNAAVEAARAGEQGRGFAVVASEVRVLAQRSASAARDIHGLIANSSELVEGGGRLVTLAGKTLLDMAASAKKVASIVEEISHATEEQSLGIDEIGKAIGLLDGTTQQNAALVEQAAAAAESLKEQAAELQLSVAVFRLPAPIISSSV